MKDNKLAMIVFGIILVMLIISLVRYISAKEASVSQVPASTSKIYHDPGNHFTITVPSVWQATENTAINTTGLNTARPITQYSEINTLMSGEVGVTVQVNEEAQVCDSTFMPNTTIAGLPAVYNPTHLSYTIQTTNAQYVLYTFYPGASILHAPASYHVQLTAGQKEEYENELQSILNTFKPLNTQLLHC
jgi:hypothetical protein